jgi:hypothetical protein
MNELTKKREEGKLYSGKIPTDYIPLISDERLQELARIRPLIVRNGKRVYVTNTSLDDLKGIAFTWAEGKSVGNVAKDLESFHTIITYHTWAYYGFFKPTQAEVLAKLNQEFTNEALQNVVAYSTQGPETSDDLNKNPDVLNDGYHEAVTTLYRQKFQPLQPKLICAKIDA